MVEVLKTDVNDPVCARMLVTIIQETFAGYRANFDLEDRDRILRVQTQDGRVDAAPLVELLRDFGFNAEVLVDDLEYSTSKRMK